MGKEPMRSRMPPRLRAGFLWMTAALPLMSCESPAVLEIPATEPSRAEVRACTELARDWPTWASDGQPETVANRIDTDVSVQEGARATLTFEAVCPGYLAKVGPQ
jgi:hypothetical protein